MSRKIIGIVGHSTGENTFGTRKSYMEYFSQFGNVVILSPSDKVVDLDLLVLPGGEDVDSSRYGQKPSFFNTAPNGYFEYFDKVMLPQYIEKNTPIFAICRGLN